MGYTNKLFIKISLALLGLLVALGLLYVAISGYISERYLKEVNQKLYGNIASSTAQVIKPWKEDGTIDTSEVQHIMHSMMVVNPSVEVYLLDTEGAILSYAAPHKKILLDSVNLAPVKQFIAEEGKCFIQGDDPRHPGELNVFSASPVLNNKKLQGYIYIILASDEQVAVTSSLFGSYILRLGANMFMVSLIGALLIGVLAIWVLTKNLRTIIKTVIRFKEGDYEARVQESKKGDLAPLASTFNDMADTINANIEEIKSVERLRRELIANVSHDLRTPLSIMQGFVETMLMKDDQLQPEERQRYLNIVLSSSEKLSKLVAQLFEYSKLEAKQILPQKEPFFISELVQDVLTKYILLGENHGITISLDHLKDLPMVFADVSLVERVIQNLMDNALKFTPDNGSITLKLEEVNDGVEIRISDTGPGITEEEQAHIFERYFRADSNGGKSTGAGLGLAIVQKILEIHNESIQVTSKQNEGATFFFQLPAYQGA
ncbi:MAG: signal transduction histidine kinase [Saprospiraceae bacterium]|jgi:signal transduction histidine kinase